MQDNTNCPYISALVMSWGFSIDFRSHITQCPTMSICKSVRITLLCKSEVGKFEPISLANEYVTRFEVSVQNFVAVHVV